MATVDGTASATWAGWSAAAGPQAKHGTASAQWAGWDGRVSLADGVTVDVYDQTGTVFKATVASAKPVYRIEMSKPGVGSVQMLLDDAAAAHMTDRAIVKMTCRGLTEAFRVNGEQADLAVDGSRWLTFDQMPSLLGVLHDSPVYPPGGLPASGKIDKDAPASRVFGPMSPRGNWYEPPAWSRPLGVKITDNTIRKGYPKELASTPSVYWIAPSPGPVVEVPVGTVAHFRREFTTTANKSVEFLFTGDNYLSLWLDGVEIISPDYVSIGAFRRTYSWTGVLEAGDHVVYARVENARKLSSHNPVGLVGAVFTLDANGAHNGVLMRTHPAYWWASTEDVGWYPAQILYHLMADSRAAGDAGPSMLSMSFTPFRDTNGVPWSGDRITKELNVMTDMLDDVIAMLSEDGIDVVANARTMTLDAFQRLGEDKSGTVSLELGDDGGNLMQFSSVTSGTRANVAVAQLADGRWHTVIDTAGLAAMGGKRVVIAVQLGTTDSPLAAERVMRQMLAETAAPVTAATAQPSTLTGTQFGRSYKLGDTITLPGKRGSGTLKQRCYAYNVDGTGDVVKVFPEFVEDKSA